MSYVRQQIASVPRKNAYGDWPPRYPNPFDAQGPDLQSSEIAERCGLPKALISLRLTQGRRGARLIEKPRVRLAKMAKQE